ncbi:ATP-binding protein [Streptomyces sp. SID4919]|uniref:ATP-binding protein n=1 Tax=unclassified Streptomyces TaxID=2593676 RepID=UPI000C0751B5|nr:ATP-binding protein [Streptomyces sp. AmelKG-E11A]MYY07726.1 ATP-binding protein [Streptomyces sp. SID4919]
MTSEPSRHCTVELQALPSRIGQIRRIISAQLRYWHVDGLIDHAALGVTELLTNVHRHAQPDKTCTVDIELLLGRLTVSVRDRDPRLPDLNVADALATCGRGLAMVAAVSESWGARPFGDSGKVVWFTLPAAAPSPVVAVPGHAVYGSTTTGLDVLVAVAAVPGLVPVGPAADGPRPGQVPVGPAVVS